MTALMAWLTPAAGPARDRLTALIGRLAAEHDAPRFQPHVTVLVTFDAEKRQRQNGSRRWAPACHRPS